MVKNNKTISLADKCSVNLTTLYLATASYSHYIELICTTGIICMVSLEQVSQYLKVNCGPGCYSLLKVVFSKPHIFA